MFTHTFGRITLVALLAAMLLTPAAQADDWARDTAAALDPAIAAAIQNRANLQPEKVTLDPAFLAAINNRAKLQPSAVALDPAIRAALLERSSAATRPDDRPTRPGPGALPQPVHVTPTDSTDWTKGGIGLGAIFAALALAIGSLIAIRARPTRTSL